MDDVTYFEAFKRASSVLLLTLCHMVPCTHRLILASSLDSALDLVTLWLAISNESQDKEVWLIFALLSRRIQSIFSPSQKMISWSTRAIFSTTLLGV